MSTTSRCRNKAISNGWNTIYKYISTQNMPIWLGDDLWMISYQIDFKGRIRCIRYVDNTLIL